MKSKVGAFQRTQKILSFGVAMGLASAANLLYAYIHKGNKPRGGKEHKMTKAIETTENKASSAEIFVKSIFAAATLAGIVLFALIASGVVKASAAETIALVILTAGMGITPWILTKVAEKDEAELTR